MRIPSSECGFALVSTAKRINSRIVPTTFVNPLVYTFWGNQGNDHDGDAGRMIEVTDMGGRKRSPRSQSPHRGEGHNLVSGEGAVTDKQQICRAQGSRKPAMREIVRAAPRGPYCSITR
jgi:hypothetical protein